MVGTWHGWLLRVLTCSVTLRSPKEQTILRKAHLSLVDWQWNMGEWLLVTGVSGCVGVYMCIYITFIQVDIYTCTCT